MRGARSQRDNTLAADELVTGIELPPRGFAAHYTYLKIRDRLSYAFALVSVAVGLELEGGRITGGALRPRRRRPQALAQRGGRGRAPRPAGGRRRASRKPRISSSREAKGFGHNSFKIDLARRAIIRALSQAAAGTPQSQSNKKIA